jgi:hypothetical protein
MARQNYLVIRLAPRPEGDDCKKPKPTWFLIEGGIKPKAVQPPAGDDQSGDPSEHIAQALLAALEAELPPVDDKLLQELQDTVRKNPHRTEPPDKMGPFLALLYNVEIESEDNGDIVMAQGTGTFSGV